MYKVYHLNEGVETEDYNILVGEDQKGSFKTFKLQRAGADWAKTGEICLVIEDDGNGYRISPIKKSLGYDEAAELLILLKFVDWYETQSTGISLYDGVIREVSETSITL